MDTERPFVVGIAGSIRNRAGLDAVEGVDAEVETKRLLDKVRDLEHRDIYHDEFLGEIQPLIRELSTTDERVVTNSDSLVLTALYGAMETADVEFLKLTDYVGLDESYANTQVSPEKMEPLVETISRADGIILGSPVYFGDRSSLMQTFINFAANRDLLKNKVVGAVSCGSKRNGGQETANVYSLFENLNHGAVIVGNGPKTCQYGGTGWGGDIGDVSEDEFGLETSLGTGLRVSQVAAPVRHRNRMSKDEARNAFEEPFQVGILIARDADGIVRSSVSSLIDRHDDPLVEFNLVDFSQQYIQACIGCDVCPTPAKVEEVSGNGKDYKCIIDEEIDDDRWQRDDLQHLHPQLIDNDALVIAVADIDHPGIDDVYQALLERTRYIRRDDWRLHNVPLAPLVVQEPSTNSIFPMKIMTAWMRHNTIVHPPIIRTALEPDLPITDEKRMALESYYNEASFESFESFIESAMCFRAVTAHTSSDLLSYRATGYENKMLDETVAERS
jgi:multimeric flavodoxin WrbA